MAETRNIFNIVLLDRMRRSITMTTNNLIAGGLR